MKFRATAPEFASCGRTARLGLAGLRRWCRSASGTGRGLVASLSLVVFVLTASAEPTFRVETLDGRVLVGVVAAEDGAVRVAPAEGEPVRVPADQLRSLRRASPTDASRPTAPTRPTGLLGEYFADTDLDAPLFQRLDRDVAFDGRDGTSLDLSSVPRAFSVRWSGLLDPPVTGRYRFFLDSDDASRLIVGDNSVIDRWGASVMSASGSIELVAGAPVPIRLEYMDIGGGQFLRFEWEAPGLARQKVDPARFVPPPPTAPPDWPGTERRGGLRAEYFRGKGMSDSAAVRTESQLLLDWGDASPAPGVKGPWSARFTGRLYSRQAGSYRFQISADDRARVTLGGKIVSDTFARRQWDREFAVELEKNTAYPLVIEYENDAGEAYLRLRWRTPLDAGFSPVPPEALGLPEGDDVPPLVRIDRRELPRRLFRNDAAGKRLTARVWSERPGPVSTEWLVDDQVILSSSVTDGTASLDLARLPLGQHRVRLRATDAAGRVVLSEPLTTDVEGVPAGTLEGPWRDARVGDADAPADLRRDGDTITLTTGAGDLQLQSDQFRLVHRPLAGEGEVAVTLASLATDARGAYAVGGLMLRQGLDPNARFVAAGLDGDGRGVLLLRRHPWQLTETIPVSLRPGDRVRIVREANTVRLLATTGQAWRDVWSGDVRLEGECQFGVFALSRAGKVALGFRDLDLRRARPPVCPGRGVLLTDGTFLPGEARLDDAGRLTLLHRGRWLPVPREAVVLIAFDRLSPDAIAPLTRRAPAVLLRGDDVLDTETYRFRGQRLSTESVLFGERSFDIWNGEVRALSLRPFTPQNAEPIPLRLPDNLTVLLRELRLSTEGVVVPHLPAVPFSEVTEIGRPVSP